MLFFPVPSARPDYQGGELLSQAVTLSFRTGELECSPDRIHAVRLSRDDVRPRWGQRILEVRHEDPGSGVERVDHHLALYRACDLHPPVVEIGRRGRNGP